MTEFVGEKDPMRLHCTEGRGALGQRSDTHASLDIVQEVSIQQQRLVVRVLESREPGRRRRQRLKRRLKQTRIHLLFVQGGGDQGP